MSLRERWIGHAIRGPWWGVCDACGTEAQVARQRHGRGFECFACFERRVTASERVGRRIACTGCGREFAPSRSDARWCSSACRQRAYRQRKEARR